MRKNNTLITQIMIVLFVSTIIGLSTFFYLKVTSKVLYTSKGSFILQSEDFSKSEVSVNELKQVILSRLSLEKVVTKMGASKISIEELTTSIQVSSIDRTRIIELSAKSQDPNLAQSIVSNLIENANEYVNNDSNLKIHLIDSASFPDNPTKIKYIKYSGLSFVFTIFLTVLLMFIANDFSQKRRPQFN